jgi:hypothetical protein
MARFDEGANHGIVRVVEEQLEITFSDAQVAVGQLINEILDSLSRVGPGPSSSGNFGSHFEIRLVALEELAPLGGEAGLDLAAAVEVPPEDVVVEV